MSAAVSASRPTDDSLLSASTSSLQASLQQPVPAESMPEGGEAGNPVEAPGDMESNSNSSGTGTSPQQHSSDSSQPSIDGPSGQDHNRQEDVEMEGTAEPEDRPHSGSAEQPPTGAGAEGGEEQDPVSEIDDSPVDGGDGSDSEEEDEYDYEHREFLERYKQDTSVPSPEELDEMHKRRADETSAHDHKRWEAQAFTPLDDPEHSPMSEAVCLTWTLDGFHGSKGQPNKLRSQSSPPITLTNHDGTKYTFSIKVFPRGNDGTDHVSVFLECAQIDSGPALAEGEQDRIAAPWWEVTAQFACIMYNPIEPRVHKFQKSHHQFTSINSDFGWPRFAGPWTHLHVREHLRYRPLLQDDKATFTAFIRLINDPTRALWYHSQSPHSSDWDPVLKTGYRGLITTNLPHMQTALISALAIWFELAPFRRLIQAFEINNGFSDPLHNFQPILHALKVCLHKKQLPRKDNHHSQDVSLDQLVTVLEWYDHVQMASVFEVWNALTTIIKHEIELGLLRKPCSAAEELSKTAQRFFDSLIQLRSDLQPVFPACPELGDETVANTTTNSSRVQSTRELAQRLSLSSSGKPSEILVFELPRQAYDPEKRRWKKLTHKIELDSEICVDKGQFVLFAIVCHTGELGSGRFHSIIQPRGPNSPWLRWATRISSRGSVLTQTRRQAILAHEGSDSSETSNSVASAAVYLRSDKLDHLIMRGPERELHDVYNSVATDALTSFEDSPENEITIAAHLSTKFQAHNHKSGFVDVWDSAKEHVTLIAMTKDQTIYDLHEKLQAQAVLADKQFLVFPLDMQRDIRQYTPPILDTYLEMSLASLQDSMNGAHVWIHVLSGEQAAASQKQYEELARTRAAESLAFLKQSAPPSVTITEQAPASLSEAQQDADIIMAGTDHEVESSQIESDVSNPLMESTAPAALPVVDVPEVDLVLQENGNLEIPAEDRTGGIGQAGEVAVQLEEKVPPPPPTLTTQEPKSHVLVMVKHFYPFRKTSETRKAGERRHEPAVDAYATLFVPETTKIQDVIERPEGDTYKKQGFRVYRERPTGAPIVLDKSETFAACSITHGSILITEPILSDVQLKTLTSQGFPVSLKGMYTSRKLPGQNNFGTGWSTCPIKFERAHGQGKVVYANGDAYKGAFVGGKRQGQGTMFYANGSDYQGQWENDQPNGDGTMIYAPSGNKYVGPFKDGKQTGSGGVTHWKDASVNEHTCRICYVEERNTVLVRCGHMVACQHCAQQLTECPVCRRQIDQIVRVWDTLQ